jgi:hypothetical protein
MIEAEELKGSGKFEVGSLKWEDSGGKFEVQGSGGFPPETPPFVPETGD